MKWNEFYKALDAGKIAPVYLFTGPEEYVKREALEALKAAGSTDSAAVMEALPSVTYDGVSGHIEFDETGDAIRTTAYVKTVNTETGDWEFVTEQTVG